MIGEPLITVVSKHGLRPAQLREIYSRLGHPAALDLPSPGGSSKGCRSGPCSPAGGGRSGAERDAASGDVAGSRGRAGDQAVRRSCEERRDQQQHKAGGTGAHPGSRAGSCPSSPVAAAPAVAPFAALPQQQQAMSRIQKAPVRPRSAGTAPAAGGGGASRRGGFMDGGGVGMSGELPQAPPLEVASERELRGEMDGILSIFTGADGGAADWQKRIGALLALEGLVKSGAAEEYEEVFDESLRLLRGAMGEQLLDRRSAVSRQACHVLGVLSRALGARFDSFAAAMVPLLFKVRLVVLERRACKRAAARVGVWSRSPYLEQEYTALMSISWWLSSTAWREDPNLSTCFFPLTALFAPHVQKPSCNAAMSGLQLPPRSPSTTHQVLAFTVQVVPLSP